MFYACALLLAAPVPSVPRDAVVGVWVYCQDGYDYTLRLHPDGRFARTCANSNGTSCEWWEGRWALRGRTVVLGNDVCAYEISTRSSRNFLVVRHSEWLGTPNRLLHIWREWR